jgi:hypothetical protein
LFAGDAAFKADTYFDLVLVNLLWYVSAAAGASSLISIVALWASLRTSTSKKLVAFRRIIQSDAHEEREAGGLFAHRRGTNYGLQVLAAQILHDLLDITRMPLPARQVG